jgi:hypothetical protein
MCQQVAARAGEETLLTTSKVTRVARTADTFFISLSVIEY